MRLQGEIAKQNFHSDMKNFLNRVLMSLTNPLENCGTRKYLHLGREQTTDNAQPKL